MKVTIQPKQLLQGYELLERIGSGGFGAVYRAYQSTIGREVAVKIILPNIANDPEFIRHFEREAQLISRLEHLHIVPLYDFWRDPEGAYIVMRWMRGGTLAGALQGGAFDLGQASLLIDQVAGGLAAAHNQHIVHRDLKPSNILLDEEGNAYIGDFGIAMDLHEGNNLVGKTKDHTSSGGNVVGSIGYISPEQLRGQDITPLSDIYSLGVTLYELITGRHPFPALNSVQQLYKQINEPLPVIESLDNEVIEGVNQVIQKATAKNPKQRYQDAFEMAAAFRESAGKKLDDQAANLVESLTRREQEILTLIIQGNTNQQIAQTLFLELSTVKWHVNRIYQKLGVRSRVKAIVRARDLNLIVSTNETEPNPSQEAGISVTFSEPTNPYKGLRAFEAADKHDFFGRESLIERLISRFRTHRSSSGSQSEFSLTTNGSDRFMAIVGPSGSGKSSLIKAGLIPAIWSGQLTGSEKWFIADMLPGAEPLDNLEIALTRLAADQAGNLRGHLERDSLGLSRAARLILPNDESELVVVIDQFEDLFTLGRDESDRDHFMDLIHGAVNDPRSRVRVVIALRADYYDRPLQYPAFGELVQSHLETVLPLSAEELERAIINPAHHTGVTFEPGLVAKIIEDVNYQPGALPLLQFALAELFEKRDGRTLTQAAYLNLGGAAGALARQAEDLYQEQSTEGRETIHQMFLRLVSVGNQSTGATSGVPTPADTRKRVLRSELLSAASDPDLLDEIIDTYATYRLLSLDHHPITRRATVEVAHEAILREWDRLQDWLEESTSDLNLHQQLIRATNEWIAGERDESFLLRGSRLASIESWSSTTQLVLTEEEQTFVAVSVSARQEREVIEHQRREEQAQLERKSNRRLKALVGVMALALVITGGLMIAAFSFARRAADQQHFAEQQQRLAISRELAAAALDNLESNPERSILLALKAAETTHDVEGTILPEVERILHMALQADRTEITIPMVGLVDFSPDGKMLAIGDSSGTLKLWETDTGQEIRELGGHLSLISGLSFSPNGRFLASSSFDEHVKVKIWDVASGSQLGALREPDTESNDVAFSPDGGHLATVDQGGSVRIWDVTSVIEQSSGESNSFDISETIFSEQVAREAVDVEFSPDGERIAVFAPNIGIVVWEVDSGEQVLEIPGVTDFSSGIAFSPNGEFLAGNSGNLGVGIWDAETGEQMMLLPETAPITHVTFSQDGQTLVSSTKDGMVSLWDIDSRSQILRILGQATGFNFLAYSQDGKRVAVGNNPQSTSIWDVSPTGSREVLTIAAHEGKVHDAVYDPSGMIIASSGEDGTLRLWDAVTGELLQSLPAQSDWVHFPAFSPDGQKLAAANQGGGISVWDVESGREIMKLINDGPALTAVTFNADGSRLAAGGLGGFAHIWDVTTGQHLTTIDNSDGLIITDLIFSPDGDHIFSYDWEGWTRTWNSDTGKHLSGEGPNLTCEATLWDAEASSDGRLQAVAAFDGLAYVLRSVNDPDGLPNYINVLGLSGHEGNVTGVAFNEQGTILATSGFDGTVRLWDLDLGEEMEDENSGEEITMLTDQNWPLEGVDFSPDGRYVVTAGDDGMVRVFVVTVEDLMELARSRLSRGFTREECRTYLHLPPCEER
jgi:WD40 repeat protein/serine/threonine protein kinase